MTKIQSLLAATLAALSSAPAMADNLMVDVGPVSGYAYDVSINGALSSVDARYYNVTNTATSDSFIAFCIEMGAAVTGAAVRGNADMTPIAGSSAGIQSLFDQRYGSLDFTSNEQVAAFQLALWELTDTTNTGSDYFGSGDYQAYVGDAGALALATQWLDTLADPTPGSDTFALTSWTGGATQNMISAAAGATVPEPGTLALLGLAGVAGLGLMRRKQS